MRYPIGIQNFEKLREVNAIYIDKTAYIRTLVETGSIYFLSRPRRFGKSLFLSTLESFFEGKRELFKNLDIDKWEEWNWESHPVLHFDLNAKDYTYKEALYERLSEHLSRYEKIYGVAAIASSLDERFRNVIETAYTKTGFGVVVLIDEYDKPILDTINDESTKSFHQDRLRAFYSVLKSADKYLKFCFLTGVSKFGQLNIFSGLNNLQDISMWNEFAGICGITEKELHKYFHEGISLCAKEWNETDNEVYSALKTNYDGYHFSPSLLDVYNPWSVLNAVRSRQIDMYWNATGGGLAFLHKLLEASRISLSDLDDYVCSANVLRGVTVNIDDAIPVLYQSGYLTIKSYDRKNMEFTLKYPNREVEKGFLEGLLPAYSGESESKSWVSIKNFVNEIKAGDINGFLKRMQTFFDDFPYENAIKTERQFQNIFYCISRMIGLHVQIERHSSRGSADMVILTNDFIYIFEFKIDKSPSLALSQINKKNYANPFAKDSRQIIKIGVEFSLEARTIIGWEIEK